MLVGIDTSCYITSLAANDPNQGIAVHDLRCLLQVKLGQKGLRQSEVVFQHLQNLPQFIDTNFARVSLNAVAASNLLRPIPDSYLPVLRTGASFGLTLSKLLGVPFYATSHQEGHIRAGLVEQPKTFS
jgi:N6-L-threonylcarbamoyladenine synthase